MAGGFHGARVLQRQGHGVPGAICKRDRLLLVVDDRDHRRVLSSQIGTWTGIAQCNIDRLVLLQGGKLHDLETKALARVAGRETQRPMRAQVIDPVDRSAVASRIGHRRVTGGVAKPDYADYRAADVLMDLVIRRTELDHGRRSRQNGQHGLVGTSQARTR